MDVENRERFSEQEGEGEGEGEEMEGEEEIGRSLPPPGSWKLPWRPEDVQERPPSGPEGSNGPQQNIASASRRSRHVVLEDLEQIVVPNYGTVSGQQALHMPELVEFDLNPDSLYFNDGQRKVDFVLVYEDESKRENQKTFHKKQKRKRQVYESNLISRGLQLEATKSVMDEKLIFVKVHGPWEVLCSYAEIMHIKLPLQPDDTKSHDSALTWISRFFNVDENIINPEQEFFTAAFENEHISDFYIQDKDSFFNSATRSRIVYFILCRGEYAMKDNVKKFGINKLLDSGIYKAAFPLHDSRFNYQSQDPKCPNERHLLYREWAYPRNIFKLQPLDLVRKYYGEKIGIYFAWLGFYTRMLLLAAIVGVGCFLYGYFTKDNCTWSQEVCDPNIGGKIIMCPQCDQECTYWNLNITCDSSKKLCIFDSFGTLVFAVFMGIWVSLFLEFWKRRQAELEYKWDTVEFLEQEEQICPEYEAKCHHIIVNEITQQEEYVPYTTCGKYVRIVFCTSAVLIWCDPGGCLLELTTQLAIIMGGKAIWNNIQEVLFPWLKNLVGRCRSATRSETIVPRWEQDYHLQPIGKLGLFYEYLEMVIQFGFVTLFVTSFPLAPLLALINNLLEIHVDAWKITTQYRRMVSQKAQHIGAWQPIMQGIAILAVITNAMIIAFTSDMIPRLVYFWSFSVPPYGDHSSCTMKGYINNTLSIFAVSDFRNESKPHVLPVFANLTICRYRDFRNPPGHKHQYEHNIYYWHVIAAKLAFILVMEHVVYFVKLIISYTIPDVSWKTKSKIKREKYLTQILLHENPLKIIKKNMGNIADKLLKGADTTLRPKCE